MGPNYRADMWVALESEATLSAAALARETHGSFASAWHVRRDFLLLRGASSRRTLLQGPTRAAISTTNNASAISEQPQNRVKS